ncbi:hypothetical protein [Actinomadura atramentaria]|uniref:hypothetical protein n=1 Tax=Actinomadura atramentaria TaxID=1990 RepID=UPI0003A85098|nr:hypothetical protein [Actinomadura atramentaria]
MKRWLYGVLGVVLGIGLFVGGIATRGSSEVKCGDQVMSPGDTCRTFSHGSSTTRGYEDQKSQNGHEAVMMMIFGPLVFLGGLVFLGEAAGVRRRLKSPAPAGYAPHATPQPYPQPGPVPNPAPQNYGPPNYGPPNPAAPHYPPPNHAPPQYGGPPAGQPRGYPTPPPNYPPPSQPYR